jgi:hypothetical protein
VLEERQGRLFDQPRMEQRMPAMGRVGQFLPTALTYCAAMLLIRLPWPGRPA